MGLYHFFNKIYCINLDRRKDRWDDSVVEFSKWGIQGVERVPAIDGGLLPDFFTSGGIPKSAVALILTNVKIIEEAKKLGLDSILILEDDVVFTDEFTSIEDKLSRVPDNWDCLYLGGNHNLHKNWKQPEMIGPDICKIHSTFTTHAVGIKRSMYDTILDLLKTGVPRKPLDVIYTDLQKTKNFYCFYPAVATQRAGYSDIENRMVNYSGWIK